MTARVLKCPGSSVYSPTSKRCQYSPTFPPTQVERMNFASASQIFYFQIFIPGCAIQRDMFGHISTVRQTRLFQVNQCHNFYGRNDFNHQFFYFSNFADHQRIVPNITFAVPKRMANFIKPDTDVPKGSCTI